MLRKTIYLDNASTSWPKPRRVLDEMVRFLAEDAGSPGRGGHRMALAAERVMQDARTKLARLLHAAVPVRIILCMNGTDALNIAIKGSLRPGDHVVCTVLDHNSVSRPLEALRESGAITLTRVAIGESGVVDQQEVRKALTRATRLVVCTHASNVTGVIQPVEEIGRIAREHETLFLVDAAQTVGVLDVNVESMRADLVAFPCHKGLLGPTGTGALYVGPRAELRPWREGGTGGDSIRATQPCELPTLLEAGTPNTVGWAGVCAALENIAPQETLAHERGLLQSLLDEIRDAPGIQVVGPPAPSARVGVLSLTIEGLSPVDAAAILDSSFDIAVRPGLHCAPYAHQTLGTFPDGTIRISPGPATTMEDMQACAVALREMVRGASDH